MQVGISQFRITNTSNLLTSAQRVIELDGECECVKGKISDVDMVQFGFKFDADSDFMLISGGATITLSNVTVEYQV